MPTDIKEYLEFIKRKNDPKNWTITMTIKQ